jgi:hypothetical protein
MSGEHLLRDIREMRSSFSARYGRPMTNDEIRTLELAEKLARSMTEPTEVPDRMFTVRLSYYVTATPAAL